MDEVKFNKKVVYYLDKNQQTIIGFIDVYVFDNYIWVDIYKSEEGKPGLSKIDKYTFENIASETPEVVANKWINKCKEQYFSNAYTQED